MICQVLRYELQIIKLYVNIQKSRYRLKTKEYVYGANSSAYN